MPSETPTNILVVDDLPEKLLAYRVVLEELGQNLVTASSGEEALKLVLREEYAVILLDVNMPGLDGFETAALIRQRKKSANTPIIFLTAFADEMRTAQGYALGAVDYIPTPVVPEILRAKVKVFIELHRMRERSARQAEEQAKREAAEKAARHSDFLARVSSSLASSLDLETLLRNLARLPLPYLAGLSAVTLVDERSRPIQTELAWTDDHGEIQSCTLDGAHQLHPEFAQTVHHVMATGKRQPLRCERLIVQPSAAGPSETNHAQRLPDVPLGLTVVLPLAARQKAHGVVTLALGYAGRTFNPDAVTLAEDLANRAAVAFENALLMRSIQDADRRKDEFLAMLAHELRNPLAPIHNAVQILHATGPHETRLRQALEMIDRQVSHMARLVDDLLNVTRIASGKILLRKQTTDLREVVRDTVADYRPLFEAARLEVHLSMPASPLWVDGDPTRLAQIVGNLLHNARKFTDPGGQVMIEVAPTAEERTIMITVRDTGIGIPPSVLPDVFGAFVQGEQGLDRGRGGLGLGLALVKGLVELHGGRVRACSPGTGLGAEFTVVLPQATRPSTNDVSEVQPSTHYPRRRILVIEDNKDAAESTRLLLMQDGHEVRTAYTGTEGVETAQTFVPHVILCDIGLPGGMSGYDVMRAVRQEPALTSVYAIALTGYGRSEDQEEARAAGFDLHLTKPVEYNDLRRALANFNSPCANR
jgi:signal transduction histidine kinase